MAVLPPALADAQCAACGFAALAGGGDVLPVEREVAAYGEDSAGAVGIAACGCPADYGFMAACPFCQIAFLEVGRDIEAGIQEYAVGHVLVYDFDSCVIYLAQVGLLQLHVVEEEVGISCRLAPRGGIAQREGYFGFFHQGEGVERDDLP